MKMQHSQNRQMDSRLFLNIVKGTAVFFMLWGHCIQCCTNGIFDFYENVVFKIIYSFHMPLFMLISGFLFSYSCKRRPLKDLLIHRTQSLLQPIVMCSVLNYYLTIVLSQRSLSAIADGPWINCFTSFWFLWSTLSASIIVGIIIKTTTNLFLRILLLCTGFGFVYLFPCSTMNLYMYPFFTMGVLFAEYRDKIPSVVIKAGKLSSILLFPLMLLFYKKKHYIYTTGIISNGNILEQLRIDGFRWSIGLVGSIFVLVIIEYLFQHTKLENNPRFARSISQLGVHSLQVYCLSVPLLSFWLPIIHERLYRLVKVFCTSSFIYSFLYTPFVAILYAIIIYYLIKLLDKSKISRILFGR